VWTRTTYVRLARSIVGHSWEACIPVTIPRRVAAL
jgi:hypothetical protein